MFPLEALGDTPFPVPSSFWWFQVFRGLGPRHFSLCLCSYDAASSFLRVLLCATPIRTFVI